MDDPDQASAAVNDSAFSVETSIDLAVRSTRDRLIFSTIYAATCLLIAPWWLILGWLATSIVWDTLLRPALDAMVLRMPPNRGMALYVITNCVGACLFCFVGVLGLAQGSALGVAIGATWLMGYALACCVYFSANRAMLTATFGPGLTAAVLGPLLLAGVHVQGLLISAMLVAGMISCSRYMVDRRALLGMLAVRQSTVEDLKGKLAVTLEASGDGLFELDILADELVVSENWLALLGYGAGDLPTPIRNWRDFIHPDDLPGVQLAYEDHIKGQIDNADVEHRMICKNGENIWVLARGRLVQPLEKGRPGKIVGATMNLTARKELERQLETSRNVAESANLAKSAFLANMSHEIRTPLNGVIGTTGALARTTLTPRQSEMVDLIISSGRTLDRLVTDILDQAKIEATEFELQVAPFDLRQEIETAAELMRARANEKGLGFIVSYEDGATGLFEGDAIRLRQIVGNLASNAIKFSDAGEVRIHVACTETDGVELSESAMASRIVISVSDTGVGFSEEVRDRLFARFVQADASISRRYGGSGLGLAICKGLVDLMGGKISAHSSPGTGSTFTVEFTLVRASGSALVSNDLRLKRETDPAISDATMSPRRLRVLMAEDHPINQRVAQLILEPMGIDLTIVGDGLSAFEIYQPAVFDLILMDMQMPVMDGLMAIRKIRQVEMLGGWPRTPIAMLTANAMEDHRLAARDAGADHLIVKPITPESMLHGIDATLRECELRAEFTAERDERVG